MKILKKYLEYFYTFFFSLLIILLLYLCLGIKWNDKSLLFSDALGQYYPLFIFLKNLSLYIFKIGGGMGTIVTIAYYLISPVNIFIFLINNLQDAMGIIIAVKLALSSLTMYIYLNKTYPKENKYFKYLFSISYMLCSFATKYYFSVIWFDVFYMLPLVILGIDNIIKKKSSLLYLISLFVSLLCNYYMGYMVCIFSVMYFIYKLKLSKIKDKKAIIKRFIIGSLFAGLLTSFILYPTFLATRYINRLDLSTLQFGFNDIGVLKGIFFGNNDYSLEFFTCAYLYTGLFNIVLLIEYFLNKKISKKEKKYTLIIFIIFIISIVFQPFYYMWHVFSTPFGLSARFVFIIDFFIVIISYKSFINIDYINNKLMILILSILVFALYLVSGNILVSIGNLAILALYLILFQLSQYNKKYYCFILFVGIFELCGSAFLCFQYPINQGTKYSIVNNYNFYQVADTGFYRIGQSKSILGLNGITSNANEVEFYLSTNANSIRSFAIKAELDYNNNYYTNSNGTSVFVNTLLANKYILNNENNSGYEEIGTYDMVNYDGTIDKLLILKNNDVYGIGTLVDSKVLMSNDNDGIEYQNQLFKNMTNINDNLFEEVNGNNGQYYINGDYYIVINSEKPTYNNFSFYLYINNNYYKEYILNQAHPKIIDHLSYQDSINYEIKADEDYGITIKIYKLNKSVFDKGIQILKDNAMTNVVYYDGYVKGNVNVTNANVLFTSIPYENGWTAYVDGKKTDVIKVSDSFIGIKLDRGEHTVEFKYETPGIKTGIIISIISFVCLIYLIRKEKI